MRKKHIGNLARLVPVMRMPHNISMPNKRKTLGEMLLELRATKDLTQAEMAQLVGVTQGTYSRWEAGSLPTGEKLTLLVESLHLNMNDVAEALFWSLSLKPPR